MIDCQEIEQLLKNTKLSSMTDVIHFVLENVLKLINFEPMHQISLRVSELQKSQGLDNVMLEEVKTLIEAIIEQREDQTRRDLEIFVQSSIQNALQHDNSRKSLRQIDIINLVSEQNKKSSQEQQKPSHLTQVNNVSQLQAIKKQISEVRAQLSKKSQKREISELKIDIQKQLSNKMAISETEKIVEKFQRQIFMKIIQTNASLQKIDYQVKKSMLQQLSIMKKQVLQNSKMQEVKQKIEKTEKKVKKIGAQTSSVTKQCKQEIETTKKQSKESIEQICSLIQNMDNKLKSVSDSLKSLTLKINLEERNPFSSAAWTSLNKTALKNMAISWERQFANQNQELYKYENGKSQILITEPGFYFIQAYISGCQKAPQIFINSQPHSRFLSYNSKYFDFFANQVVKLTQNINKIWVRLDNESQYSEAIFKINRVA